MVKYIAITGKKDKNVSYLLLFNIILEVLALLTYAIRHKEFLQTSNNDKK